MPIDIDELLARLTIEQKAALTSGADLWRTTAVPEVGIPQLKVTDGPIGARGDLTSGETSTCFPCGAALGATWDVELAERVGGALAEETKAKGAHVLLGPTVNLHRHPLAGRNFECYSEDPELTARLASAWIRGLQAGGVGSSIKHYVANDQEHERMTISSQVGDRTLRELYLRPFEAAVAEADPWVVMAAYNRINGEFATEHRGLLIDVLKREWGWAGVVVSDWYATHDTARAAMGGTDLEMPGPPAQLGPKLAEAVAAGTVTDEAVDEMARRMLHLLDRAGRFDDPELGAERSEETDERRALAREVASSAIVLLRNDGVLPLDASSIGRLAVLGPAAHPGFDQGGGSAQVQSHRRVSPLDGLVAALPGVEITHARGCAPGALVPPIRPELLRDGWAAAVWTNPEGDGEPVHLGTWTDARYSHFGGRKLKGVDRPSPLRIELRTTFTPDQSGPWTFHLACVGRTTVVVDGKEQLHHDEDGPQFVVLPTALPRYEAMVELDAGRPVDIAITLTATSRRTFPHLAFGVTPPDPHAEIAEAAALAAGADAAIVIVGTGPEVETEGVDRADLALPGDQDALVSAVLAAQPRTVVVVGAGAPLALPWLDAVPATVWSWFGGQEAGHALADVLLGAVDPGGRLPTTMPVRIEDTAAFATYPGSGGEVHYDEGLLIGHRWHDATGVAPLLPFGHGLSYTTFELGEPTATVAGDGQVEVVVPARNIGSRDGVEVVQVYAERVVGDDDAPLRSLAGFAKVALRAGAGSDVRIGLPARALASWDSAAQAWHVSGGSRTLVIARSSAELLHRVVIELPAQVLATPQR